MDYKIASISGDGIGPEIVREAKRYWTQWGRSMATRSIMRIC